MIRKFTIDPPFSHQAGDVYAREGNTLKQIRGGVTIDTRTLGAGTALTQSVHVGGSNVTEFFEEQKMPGQVVTMVDASRGANGVVRFNFSNGTQREFPDDAAALEDTKYIDTEPRVLEDALILKTYRNSPDGANLENMVGGSVSSDFTASVPIVLTQPE